MTETGAVDFSRFAVTFNASSATPGRPSTISVALTPPQPAGGSDPGSDEPGSDAGAAPASVLLLFRHTVPDGADGRLELLLSGEVAQPYMPTAQSATMQPAQGDRASLQAVLREVERYGVWLVNVTRYGAEAFAGSASATLDFDWPGDSTSGFAACACELEAEARPFATDIAPPSMCQPLVLQDFESCDSGAGPVQGFSRRSVSCRAGPERVPADLGQCSSGDCTLTAAQRALLQGFEGSTDAVVTTACPFWHDCATAHRYEVSDWGPCSAECWPQRPDMTSQPFQRRNVTCVATMAGEASGGARAGEGAPSGVGVAVPAVECEAAGVPDAPPTLRACNSEPCPVGGCTYSDWGACSNSCGVGERTRMATCGGSDSTCAPCTELRSACYSPCSNCDANEGRGACVFGDCITVADGVACECEEGFTGALLPLVSAPALIGNLCRVWRLCLSCVDLKVCSPYCDTSV